MSSFYISKVYYVDKITPLALTTYVTGGDFVASLDRYMSVILKSRLDLVNTRLGIIFLIQPAWIDSIMLTNDVR